MKNFFIRLFVIIVIGLVVIYIVYPYTKNFSTVRNAQRKADLLSLSQALDRYYSDHSDELYTTLPIDPVEICRTGATDCKGLIDLNFLIQDNMLPKIPEDPGGSLRTNGTGYFIHLTNDHRISLTAPTTDLGENIGISTHRF